jgi:hypothetical protein
LASALASAFEDRGDPTGIAPSPEPFEAKPHEKRFDYNYSDIVLVNSFTTPEKHCLSKVECRKHNDPVGGGNFV